MNTAKCEHILSGMDKTEATQSLLRFQEIVPSIRHISPVLLGATLSTTAISTIRAVGPKQLY